MTYLFIYWSSRFHWVPITPFEPRVWTPTPSLIFHCLCLFYIPRLLDFRKNSEPLPPIIPTPAPNYSKFLIEIPLFQIVCQQVCCLIMKKTYFTQQIFLFQHIRLFVSTLNSEVNIKHRDQTLYSKNFKSDFSWRLRVKRRTYWSKALFSIHTQFQ